MPLQFLLCKPCIQKEYEAQHKSLYKQGQSRACKRAAFELKLQHNGSRPGFRLQRPQLFFQCFQQFLWTLSPCLQKKIFGQQRGSIRKLIEPYPKPIRKKLERYYQRDSASLINFFYSSSSGIILFSMSSAEGKASLNSFGKRLVI